MDISFFHHHNPRQQKLHQGLFLLLFLFDVLPEQVEFPVGRGKDLNDGGLFFRRGEQEF